MGMKRLNFKWCLIHIMKRGVGGIGWWMRCGARGIDSMAGEAGVELEGGGSQRRGRSSVSGGRRKKRPGRAEWAERPNRPAGQLGRLGWKLKRISFQNKNWIFKFTNALEFCTRKFRRNFDVGIFPKFF
jgi:hypothetical protein